MLDLQTGITRQAAPSDRISKSTGYRYQPLDTTMKDCIKEAVALVIESWERNG